MKNKIQYLIVADPQICHGKPTIKGTRIMVWQILELLEAGENAQSIHQSYPSLPKGTIPAVLHYAAERAKGVSFSDYAAHDKDSKRHHIFA